MTTRQGQFFAYTPTRHFLTLKVFFTMGQRLLGIKQQSNKQMLLQPEHKTFCWHLVMLFKRPAHYKRLSSLTSCRRLSFLTSCPCFFSRTSCPCLFSLTRCPLPLTVSMCLKSRQFCCLSTVCPPVEAIKAHCPPPRLQDFALPGYEDHPTSL